MVFWNLTGQERYKTVQPRYMLGVSGHLLLFDLTRLKTFKKLPEWIKFIRQNSSDAPILLIGSKADLFHLKEVDDVAIEKFVNDNELQGYFEVSFKTGLNVELVIQKMTEIIYQSRIKNEKLVTDFKLKRQYLDRPLILNEQKVLSSFNIASKTIYDMIFDEILNQINFLEQSINSFRKDSKKSRRELALKEIEKISANLNAYDKKIKILQENPPIPLPTFFKLNLTEEWKSKRDILLYNIFTLKDLYNFLGKLN